MRLTTLSTYTKQAAKSSHRDLLFDARRDIFWQFWLSQWKFVVQLLFSAVVILALAPYTYDFKQGGWVLLTFFTHSLAALGACHTAKALAKLEVEMAVVSVVEANAERNLDAAGRTELDKLEQVILPRNDSQPPPAMIRLFQNIVKEAKDRKFESSVNLLQPSREESLEDIFRLQNYQKIALWLGILGTFVGILLALQSSDLKNIHELPIEEFGKVVTGMFDKLVISFSASLAGLEAAIILGFFLLLLRKRQETYFQSTESAAITMLSVARKAINKDELLSELSQVTDELDKVRRTVSTELGSVYRAIGSLQQQVIAQTQQIQDGIDKLPETNKKFDDALKQSEADQRRMADEMRDVYDSIALKTALRESIDLAGRHISGAITPHTSQISSQLANFSKSVEGMNEMFGRQIQSLSDNVGKVEGQLKEQSRGTSEFSRMVDVRLHELSKKIAELQATRGGLWQKLKAATQNLLR